MIVSHQEIQVDRVALAAALSLCAAATEKRSGSAGVLFHVRKKNVLTVSTVADDVGVFCEVNCEGSPCSAQLELSSLRSFVDALDNKELLVGITHAHPEQSVLTIKSGTSTLVEPLQNGDRRAELSISAPFSKVRSKPLREVLDMCVPAMSGDESRPHLGGIRVEFHRTLIRAAATDGHRLHLCSVNVEEGPDWRRRVVTLPPVYTHNRRVRSKSKKAVSKDDVSRTNPGVTVPSQAMRPLLRLLHTSPTAQIAVDERYFYVRVRNTTVAAKIVDHEFPPYRAIVPKASKDGSRCIATVDRKVLLASVGRCKQFSVYSGVFLVTTSNEIACHAETSPPKALVERIPISDGTPFRVAIAPSYLWDAVNAVTTQRLSIFAGPTALDPIAVVPAGATPNPDGTVVVVMPLRI